MLMASRLISRLRSTGPWRRSCEISVKHVSSENHEFASEGAGLI